MQPGLNIIGGVHPCGFKGPTSCMLDIDLVHMPSIEGMLNIDGNSYAIPEMGGIGFTGIGESIALLCGIKPVIGSFIDILGINIGVDDDSIILLSVMESFIESPIDISRITGPADLLEPPVIIPAIACTEDEGMPVFAVDEKSRPELVPA